MLNKKVTVELTVTLHFSGNGEVYAFFNFLFGLLRGASL